MAVTQKKKNSKNKSIKNNINNSSFKEEITTFFLELIIMIKLFHWNTYSYAQHGASDKLYASMNEHMDKFMEVLLGKTYKRLFFKQQKTLKLLNYHSKKEIIKRLHECKSYLVNLDNNNFLYKMSNSDLFNIRDEILADMNQFLYLLSLK